MGNPIHFATCRETCRVRAISIFLYEELFKFCKKFLNPCIPNFDMCKIEKNLRPKSGPPPSPLNYFVTYSKLKERRFSPTTHTPLVDNVTGVNILHYSQKNIWEKFPILDNFGKSLFILTKIFRSIQKFYWKIYI